MNVRRLGAALAALPLVSCAGLAPARASDAPLVDHHIHIFSPVASRVVSLNCAKLGPVKCPPQVSKDITTAADVVAALDKAGIQEGVLLSLGYIYGSPNYSYQHLDLAKDTRAENTYVVDQAKSQCARLVAFIGVDPMAPNAIDEINYWRAKGGVTGVKIHLGNSAVDLRSPQDVAKLKAVFQAAAKAHFAIVIHMQTRASNYGAGDVAIFLRDVVPAAKGVPIQIAHAGSGGGADAQQLAALKAFADGMKRDPAGTKNLFFDLAMVPDLVANVGKIEAKPADVQVLTGLMRQIGLQRFVLGSDWTAGLNLAPYYDIERQALGLTEPEWIALAKNAAPYMAARRTCPAAKGA